MSAFVSIVYPDSIRLLTDGAIYNSEGVLLGIRRKVWASDVVPIAITGRGSTPAITVIAEAITMMTALMPVKSADVLLSGLEEFFAGLGERGFPAGQMGEYLIAAWSETRGPIQYYVTSVTARGYNDGVKPFQMTVAPPTLIAGALDEGTFLADMAAAGMTTEMLSESEALKRHGADIMELMRRRPGPNPVAPDDPPLFGIGGQCDLTTITPEGVTIETLRQWPDKIGEKIRPEGAACVPSIAQGTRRERRAAAKLQKKRRKELA